MLYIQLPRRAAFLDLIFLNFIKVFAKNADMSQSVERHLSRESPEIVKYFVWGEPMKTIARLVLLSFLLTGCFPGIFPPLGSAESEEEKEDEESAGDIVDEILGNDPKKTVEYSYANPEVQEWSGKGDKLISGIKLNKGAVIFSLSHSNGTSNFIVQLNRSNGDYEEGLANEIGDYSGTVFAEVKDDSYFLEIQADGDWVIKTVTPEPLDSPLGKITGNTDAVSRPFLYTAGAVYKVIGNYVGTSNFIVAAYNVATGEYIEGFFNEIDDYSGESSLSDRSSAYVVLVVQGRDGQWEVSLEKQ